ncbi:PAS domain S-box protein [Fontibacter flavus]|uniref:histidine kinase n=1 Tax=Fontibacter flavus TaxID=654838 RepID=A0ABV6FUT6_9BACT
MDKKPDFSSFFYFNPLPSWVYDLNTFKILDVNKAALEHYGYSKQEFLDLTIKDLRPKEELPKLLAAHENINHREGNLYFGVFTHQKKNGDLIRMKINGHKVDYLDKVSVMVVCQDVTQEEEQLKTLTASFDSLRESEARFRTIFEIATLGIAQVDPNSGKIILVNSFYETITGYSKEELLQISFSEITHPEDREKDWEIFRKAMRGEQEYRNEKRYVRKDGSIVWVRLHLAFIRDENGNPYRTVAICEDITSKKDEEHRLKLLESVITNTNDAILITEAEPFDEPGPRILYVNEAFTKMTGYTADEVIGKSPRLLQGPKSDKEELAKLGKALRNWESCEITTVNYKKSGEEFWINFSVSPVADERGWFTHWVAIERDVTEQKRKEIEKELLAKISLNFSFENDLITSLHELCKTVTKFGDFDLAEIWIPNIEGSYVNLIAHHSATPKADLFYKWSKGIANLKFGEGLPGTVWKNKTTVLWNKINDSNEFVRKEASAKANIKSVLGIPLLFNANIVGVLVIGTESEVEYLQKYIALFNHLELYIGSEINRKKLESDLKHLYESVPDIICIADFQGRFLKMNKSGCKLLGYTEEELLFHSFKEFVHPDDSERTAKEVAKQAQGNNTFYFENRYITKNGEICWLSWTCNTSLQEGIVYASAKNITSEKKLRELNQTTSKLARIGSWEVDLLKNKVFWNEMVHLLHETDPNSYDPEIGEAINFYREDFRPIVTDAINQCIQSGIPFDFEAVLITLNNKELWVRVIGNAEMIDGRCVRIYGSFQDIHEKKETELRLQSLADNLPGVVFQYLIRPDGSDEMKYVTKGSEQLWGLSPQKAIENTELIWNQIKLGGNYDTVKRSIEESIQNKTKWTARWKHILPSGEVQQHLGFGTPGFLTDGTVIFNSIVLDITQEAKNEELLRQATEMAKIGSWELNLINQNNDSMYWSPMTREILEVDKNYNPSLSGGFEFYTEESKKRINQAVDLLIKEGKEFDEELLIITQSNKEKWIRCIGKCERVHGKCVKIFGSFQDIHTSKSLDIQIREILGSISDAFYAVDEHWNFSYFNKEAEILLEKTASEVLGKNIWEVFPSAIGTPIQDIYEDVVKSNQPRSSEYFYPGNGKWYEVNVYPSNGGVSTYFKNIDERKQSAIDLEKAYQEKNKILESIGDAFFALDKNWTVTYWNKEAELVLGKSRNEMIGQNLWEKYADAIDSDFYRQYHESMETGRNLSFEEYYPTLQKWFEVSVYPSQDGLSVYFKDVTLRKEADIRLHQANERFEKVTEATNDAIWDWDIVNDTLYWGVGFKTLFGLDIEKIRPTQEVWTDHIHPEDKDGVISSLNSIIESGQTNWTAEYRYKRQNGSFANVIDRGIVIRGINSEAVRMVGAMTDISERKRHEEQLLSINQTLEAQTRELQRSNEELEQFAFITSHDLQEPLRMISSFMDQLKRKYSHSLDDKAHQYIDFAIDGAKRMKQIILDLLLYSRANRPTEEHEEVSLNEIVTEFTLLRRKLIAEKNATITFENLPVLETYRAPITQIFHCLLDNGLKYTRQNVRPTIEIKVRDNDGFWEFLIKDNGIGIDEKFHEKIFIIFQRLHNRKKHDGTGIGLSIAKRCIEFLGGKIWLESTLGEGTTFYFTIAKTSNQQYALK